MAKRGPSSSSYGSEKRIHPSEYIHTTSSTFSEDEKKNDKLKDEQKNEKFVPDRRSVSVFTTLAVLTLMAALDGTSISVALPVRTVR